jgi:hypothetical protein
VDEKVMVPNGILRSSLEAKLTAESKKKSGDEAYDVVLTATSTYFNALPLCITTTATIHLASTVCLHHSNATQFTGVSVIVIVIAMMYRQW